VAIAKAIDLYAGDARHGFEACPGREGKYSDGLHLNKGEFNLIGSPELRETRKEKQGRRKLIREMDSSNLVTPE
jgi:hypothetical protein